MLRYGNESKIFILDTDNTYMPMEEGLKYGDLMAEARKSGQLVLFDLIDMTTAYEAAKQVLRDSGQGDLIVLDMADWAWDAVQDEYIERTFGKDPWDYYFEMRREVKEVRAKTGGKKGHKAEFGGQEGTDWQFINKVYRQFEMKLTAQSAAHVCVVTGETKLDENRGASADDLKKYKVAGGMKPKGQKGLGHRTDTILRMTRRANGQRQLTMVGDRGREDTVWEERDSRILNIDDMPRGGFARRYLRDIAGWRIER